MTSDLDRSSTREPRGEHAENLDISVRGPLEGAAVVRLAGELDVTNADIVSALLVKPLARGSDLVVDLGELTFMDAAGMGALVRARNEAKTRGRALRLRHLRANVLRALKAASLDRVFRIEP